MQYHRNVPMRASSSNTQSRISGHESAAPFLIVRGRVGALLIHGLAASPYDLRTLGEWLAARNVSVYGMRIAGHGTSFVDLERTTPADWRQSVDEGYGELKRHVTTVFVIGDSFGGNLAIDFAVRHQASSIAGIITLGTPLTLHRDWLNRLLIPLARSFKRTHEKSWLSPVDRAVNDAKGSYNAVPLRSIQFFYQLLTQTRQQLPKLTTPLLVFCSKQDRVVKPESAESLVTLAGSRNKQLFWIDEPTHHVLESGKREGILREIFSFLKYHTPAALRAEMREER